MTKINLLQGNNLETLKKLPDNSIDSIVTDPPYGLNFMGKKWDYDVPSIELWKECFRVLKHGGHLLSFGGTRTYHRLVVNIEDAGFEIRDCIQWLYGSGFPKSTDVSKRIDKEAGAERDVIGKSNRHNSKEFGGEKYGEFKGGIPNITAPSTDSAKQWQGWGTALKPANEPICVARKPLEKGLTVAENVLKYGTGALNIDGSRVNNSKWDDEENLCNSCADNVKNKTKHTAQASKESIAIKSAELTLKENQTGHQDILKMDIGCSEEMLTENINTSLSTSISGKIKTDQNQKDLSYTTSTKTKKTTDLKTCSLCQCQITSSTIGANGRWPSNLILDEVAAELLDEHVKGRMPAPAGNKNKTRIGHGSNIKFNSSIEDVEASRFQLGGDPQTASRFFYVAKASKSERNKGLEGMPLVESGIKNDSGRGFSESDPHKKILNQNFHPTVKPTKLMQYLIKLVTPPNGTVLDPFMGSGSTGVAAKELGFNFVGCELSPEYFEIAQKRIK